MELSHIALLVIGLMAALTLGFMTLLAIITWHRMTEEEREANRGFDLAALGDSP